MKVKNYFTLLLFFIFFHSHSQTIDDIIRVSSYYNDGTARFNAMGGAFSALGGDLSAISVNPASSSIFTYNEFGITMGLDAITIENDFYFCIYFVYMTIIKNHISINLIFINFFK